MHQDQHGQQRLQAILDIVNKPNPTAAQQQLATLQLDGIPSQQQIFHDIESRLLLPKRSLPDHWLSTYQVHWKHSFSVPSLLTTPPSEPPTTLSFVRAGLDGRVTGYTQTPTQVQASGLTSTSLSRAPAPLQSFVRGKSGHVPFWPGGLDEILQPPSEIDLTTTQSLKRVPPGLSRGLRFEDDEETFDPIEGSPQSDQEVEPEGFIESANPVGSDSLLGSTEIDDLLPSSRKNLMAMSTPKSRPRRAAIQKRDWAHVVDTNKPMKNFHELVPEMAHKYPFELDTFQKEAVYHLEMGDSVFVAAHTSAGKTVVAEYAIALAQKHMTRAIYTSPIKALSNQKFRDFKQTFSSASVGILTGDVQINPEASCLVMTTEILRSMLYKGADLIRDVEFVIFDEVHYVNDAERGVVWEEVIIMLPDHVSIILLSATVPNTKEFADWVGRTKKKDIYVISTVTRPVPLEHYLYAGRNMFKIVDAKGRLLDQGYKDAGEALRRKQDKEREAAGLPPVQRLGARAGAPQRGQRGAPAARGGGRGAPSFSRGGGGGGRFHTVDKSLYVHLVGHLRKEELLPVVIFTLSKKRCEENASTLTNVDLCSAVQKSKVHTQIDEALKRLDGSDRKLPQIARMRDLLSRGIGVHHGGLLPIVKEVVEILFARGLVKVLFATETFAMGVNMPAKSVVFSGTRKHDGRSFRDILPGEYTQMAGRAGRRGLDTTGTVIILIERDLPEFASLSTMILGTPTRLQSQFRLTFNMILNLLRVEALKVEEMIKRSFSENASQKMLPDQQKRVEEDERKLHSLRRLECDVCVPDINTYYELASEVVRLNQEIINKATENQHGSRLLVPGRVVILRDSLFNNNAAVLLRSSGDKHYIFLVLVDPQTKEREKSSVDATPPPPMWPTQPSHLVMKDSTYHLLRAPITSIAFVTNNTLKIDVSSIVDIRKISSMNSAVASLSSLVAGWISDGAVPEVDWSRIRLLDFQELLRERDYRASQLTVSACLLCEHFADHYTLLHGEMVLRKSIANLKLAISDQNLELIPDYEQRIEVLKELSFIDQQSTVLLKGRVACEINSADELVLTELILENTLAKYESEEVVALLSCFVFQEKTDSEPVIPPKLEEGMGEILAIAERVGAVLDRHKVSVLDTRQKLKFGLVEVVYEWAKGMPFEQITGLTDVPEGTIVRVITRLDETCREVRDAARVIGDATLMKKMEEAQTKIKRDIVFAASLYF